MKKDVKDLKNSHKGEDVWVLASGGSMNFIDGSFFDNKVTVGVNRICRFFKCDYVVSKDTRGFGEIGEAIGNPIPILSKHNCGNVWDHLNTMESLHYIFDHPPKPGERPMLDAIHKDSDQIIVSYSTITSAIHFAAYTGAKNIIICGHDCGSINDKVVIEGYYDKIRPVQGSTEGYKQWLSQIEGHSVAVREKLKKEYGCNIYSLNPFLNVGLENNVYKK